MGDNPWDRYWTQDNAAELDWWKQPAPEVLSLIAGQSPTQRPIVLDLGCGLGRHTIAFALAGFRVTAVDASAAAIAHVADWAASLRLAVETRVASYLDDCAPAGTVDIVLSYNVIYHGYRAQFGQAIANVRRFLKPGGVFFFTCPTRSDGKYGYGIEVAPHTWLCERSMTPGDTHYFADEADLDEFLAGFRQVWRKVDEGHWDNRGTQQVFSNWQVLAHKIEDAASPSD